MPKIRTMIYSDGTKHHLYNCPGCGYEHAFSPNMHSFDGNMNEPVISPSLLQSNPQNHHTCHSYIGMPGRNIPPGFIEFLSDCWHDKRGQIVELPEYPAEQELLMDFTKE